jgi:hypothetical protein
VGPPSHSGDVRHWEERHGIEGEAFTLSITNPACSIAAPVLQTGWQPPSSRGQKVASAKHCKCAYSGRRAIVCS